MPADRLIPIDEALSLIMAAAHATDEIETLPLLDSLYRISANDLQATIDVPPYDNSAMDGYAVRHSDLAVSKGVLAVSQCIAAGHIGASLQAGTAARIFTGAPIPPSADAVVMQEDTELLGESLRIIAEVSQGQHIRPRGQDIMSGSIVVPKGKRLLPQDIGLLASVGVAEVDVYKSLRVAVISTGDELVEPGQGLAAGQIYNSNRYTVSALLKALGFEVVDGGIVKDDLAATCQQIAALSSSVDVIVSTGGVSVGDEDHVKSAVESLGELALWKLNIKPGKPVAFGTVNRTPFFGLPGNPASAFVTFCLLARPFLLRCQGQLDCEPTVMTVKAGFEMAKPAHRQQYLRARVIEDKVTLFSNQSSGVLMSTSWANALVIIPPLTSVHCGDRLEVLMFSELLTG